MKPNATRRRSFLKLSALALGAVALPSQAQSVPRVRLEWQQYKTTKWYPAFLQAISYMKSNDGTPTSMASWQYWVNVHLNFCPHETTYFLAWHRGYLYYLEQALRSITQMNDFVLPYWDYYRSAQMPSEFTDPATGNPLYTSGRQGSNVRNALTLAPFASTVTNFPRGTTNAFETSIETQPHNPVHNLIGGVMASMSSPIDPIFYLHHGNIDRLWLAWVAAGGGRRMPARSTSYWSGSFTYASNLTLPRTYTYDTVTLGYDYSNRSMPTSLPVALKDDPRIIRVQATPSVPAAPPVGNFPAAAAGSSGANAFSLGGRRDVALAERSVSVQLPLAASHAAALDALARTGRASVPGSALEFNSARVVLNGLHLTGRGAQGGYFYSVYLNLPASAGFTGDKEQYLIGTMGPFEIDSAGHHGGVARRDFQITDKLAGLSAQELSQVTVSFVRVDGDNPPAGQVIGIDEVRVELSAD